MKQNLVIIGFGMVAKHFCDQFIQLGLDEQYSLSIFSKEKHLAYDRVKLTNYAKSKDFSSIILNYDKWYDHNKIKLYLGEAVTAIDSDKKIITTSHDKDYSYDKLIFATGSRPFVPPIPGADLRGVFTYRTRDDVDALRTFTKEKKVGLVIGGGLLGIEAADFLRHQGLETHIIEMADFLMPRQLNPEAAEMLKAQIEKKGFLIRTGIRTQSIERQGKGLRVSFSDGQYIDTDIIVISAGIRPNHEVAAKANIDCSPGGGIICNDKLETSTRNIYAIGECLRHRNIVYGLVAPAYKMADVLTQNLAGKDTTFEGADTSTRLKLLGENVVSFGMALQPLKPYIYKTDDCYRMINTKDNHILGAIGIGEWPDLGRIQSAIENKMLATSEELKNFLDTGSLWNIESSVEKWPDETIICNCLKVTKGEIVTCLKTCDNDIATVKKQTGACTACGSCEGLIAQLAGQEVELRKKPNRGLLISSSICLITILTLLLTPVMWAVYDYDSTAHQIVTALKSNLGRQITGFSILAFTLFAAAISLRKRIKKITFGKYSLWRLSHAIFAIISLLILMAHTGFNSGRNINAWLFWTFVTMNTFGVITGFTTSFEFYGTNKIAAFCRRWRRQITFIHFLVFWPLPVLIAFHILQAYYFAL